MPFAEDLDRPRIEIDPCWSWVGVAVALWNLPSRLRPVNILTNSVASEDLLQLPKKGIK